MSDVADTDRMRVQLADAMHAARSLPWAELLRAVRSQTESLSKVVREREEAYDQIDRLRKLANELGFTLQRTAYYDRDLLQARSEIAELRSIAPLRRLIWQAIPAGQPSFTVAEVAERLAALGVPAPSSRNEISNALGYWVKRGRLERCSKGVYRVAPLDVREEAS